MRGYFITGTDTGVGKTLIACAITRLWAGQGHPVAVMKPVASGCDRTAAGLRNADAEALMAVANVPSRYDEVNPYALEAAMAPHIAAARAGVRIDIDRIEALYRGLCQRCDRIVVEGVGGWRVPLGGNTEIADLARSLSLPVILVVGLRLGCLNHTLLSMASIEESAVPVAGWISTQTDRDYAGVEASIAALTETLQRPHLAHVPWLESDREAEIARILAVSALAPG